MFHFFIAQGVFLEETFSGFHPYEFRCFVQVCGDIESSRPESRLQFGECVKPRKIVLRRWLGGVTDRFGPGAAPVFVPRSAPRPCSLTSGRTSSLKPEWTPRELRHSFVSLLSDHGIPLERIALLVGHSSQATTEAVYRKQLRPVITEGAEAMDVIFAKQDDEYERLGA